MDLNPGLLGLLDAHERIDDGVDVLGIDRCFVSGKHFFNLSMPLLFRQRRLSQDSFMCAEGRKVPHDPPMHGKPWFYSAVSSQAAS
jgi:hypothetical protein